MELIMLAVDGATLQQGFSIAIAGMLIVFLALSLISAFIACLPRMLDVLGKYFPESDKSHLEALRPEKEGRDEEAILAAIGYVLHHELQSHSQD